jgi:hypothetical protein
MAIINKDRFYQHANLLLVFNNKNDRHFTTPRDVKGHNTQSSTLSGLGPLSFNNMGVSTVVNGTCHQALNPTALPCHRPLDSWLSVTTQSSFDQPIVEFPAHFPVRNATTSGLPE